MGYIRNSHYHPIVSLLNKSHSPYLTKELHPLVCIQQTEKKVFCKYSIIDCRWKSNKKSSKITKQQQKDKKKNKKGFVWLQKEKNSHAIPVSFIICAFYRRFKINYHNAILIGMSEWNKKRENKLSFIDGNVKWGK